MLPPLIGAPWEREPEAPVIKCPYCAFGSDFVAPVMFHVATQHPGREIPSPAQLTIYSPTR